MVTFLSTNPKVPSLFRAKSLPSFMDHKETCFKDFSPDGPTPFVFLLWWSKTSKISVVTRTSSPYTQKSKASAGSRQKWLCNK